MNEQIIEIPLEQLHESPFNPREIFDDAYLAELAADIKQHGRVLSPLLVRPHTNPLFRDDPDGATGYEIVFGHCRYRASLLAEMATARCEIRAMGDEEVKRAQISENLSRKDVHPIEEARGFQALIDEHNETADRIAEQFGKSRSYVYGRLKLLEACPAVTRACLAGDVGAEVALLVARLRTPKLQEKALDYIRAANQQIEDGGARSYRRIRDLLNEKFTLELKGAIFDIEDEMLVPLAGNCVRCVKRTGNAPEFVDFVQGNTRRAGDHYSSDHMPHTGTDVCTDPDCFDAKKKAHLKREAAKLEAAGKTVVQGAKARAAIDAYGHVKGGFVKLADVRDELKKVAKDAKPAVVTIQDPRNGKLVQAVKVEDLKAVGAKVKVAQPSGNSSAQQARSLADVKVREEKAKALTERNEKVVDQLLQVMATQPRTTLELYWMAERVFEGIQWDVRDLIAKRHGFARSGELEKVLGQWPADRLALFAVECVLLGDAIVDSYSLYGNKAPAMDLIETAAKHYGVDIPPVDEGTSTPSTAAQAQKKAAGGAKKGKASKATTANAVEELKDDAGVAGEGADLFEDASA